MAAAIRAVSWDYVAILCGWFVLGTRSPSTQWRMHQEGLNSDAE